MILLLVVMPFTWALTTVLLREAYLHFYGVPASGEIYLMVWFACILAGGLVTMRAGIFLRKRVEYRP